MVLIRRVIGVLLALVLGCAVLVAARPAIAATRLPAQGTFVSNRGQVYRVVGGSLTKVYSWQPFGGPQRTVAIDNATADSARGRLIADGTFVRSLPDQRIYRLVGGAPIYVSTWTPFGGPQRFTDVDARAIGAAARGSRDGGFAPSVERNFDRNTFVRSGQDGRVFQFVLGVPVYVHSWAAFGGPQPAVTIDGNAISHSGQGPWSFVHTHIPNGTALLAVTAPGQQVHEFVMIGDAPVYLTRTDHLPEAPPDPIRVDARAVSAAGGPYPDDRLRAQPADGTFFYAFRSFDTNTLRGQGRTYWTHAGAAIPVNNEGSCPAYAEHALIDQEAVDRAGTGGVYNHLAPVPVDHAQPPC